MALQIDSIFPPADERDEPISNETIYNALSPSGIIKSIQYGSITVAAISNTATITAVNTSYSVIFHLGTTVLSGFNDLEWDDICNMLTLTNSTTVTASRIDDDEPIYVTFVVVEFEPSIIKSLQQGTITMTGAASSNTATITSVVASRSLLINCGTTCSGTTDTIDDTDLVYSKITLTNENTITCTRNIGTLSPSTTLITKFMIIEFI